MLYVIITLKNFRQRQIKFFNKSYRNTYKVLHVYLLTFQLNILVAWMLKEREKQRCEKRREAARFRPISRQSSPGSLLARHAQLALEALALVPTDLHLLVAHALEHTQRAE